jgi:hypothetical protein
MRRCREKSRKSRKSLKKAIPIQAEYVIQFIGVSHQRTRQETARNNPVSPSGGFSAFAGGGSSKKVGAHAAKSTHAGTHLDRGAVGSFTGPLILGTSRRYELYPANRKNNKTISPNTTIRQS